tara:strand:+ start:619 stop:843 length:225 start_codon:yes stop_codon:yes gene_type:complete
MSWSHVPSAIVAALYFSGISTYSGCSFQKNEQELKMNDWLSNDIKSISFTDMPVNADRTAETSPSATSAQIALT